LPCTRCLDFKAILVLLILPPLINTIILTPGQQKMSEQKKKEMLEKLSSKKKVNSSSVSSSDTSSTSATSSKSNPTEDSKAAEIAKLKAGLQRKKEERARQQAKDDQDEELERLRREHEEFDKSESVRTSSVSRTTTSREEARQLQELKEKNRKLEEELKAMSLEAATSSASVSSTSLAELKKKMAEREAELKKVVGASTAAEGESTKRRLAALEKEKESLLRKRDALPSTSMLSSDRMTAERSLARVQYGIDVCFLMDCTGSMSSFINAAKTKIREIVREVEKIESRAIVRIAFVGYRDHCDGARRLEKLDFIESTQPAAFEAKLQDCPAMGGGDGPEDVAGGLQSCAQLSWNSSTRLLIHFADAPCHGTKYHSGMQDDYPSGDPAGLQPEDLLRELAKKRVEFYFMRIHQYTDKMTEIFKNTYEEMGKQFFINPVSANASDFVPKVVNSIRSSMARSAAFGGVGEGGSSSSSSAGKGTYGTSGVF